MQHVSFKLDSKSKSSLAMIREITQIALLTIIVWAFEAVTNDLSLKND